MTSSQEYERLATASMAYAYQMSQAVRKTGEQMLRAVVTANKLAEDAGIDPAKVGLN